MPRPIRLIASLALASWLSLSSPGLAFAHGGKGSGSAADVSAQATTGDQARGHHAAPIEERARRHAPQAARDAAARRAVARREEARRDAARHAAVQAAERKAAHARATQAAMVKAAAAIRTAGNAAAAATRTTGKAAAAAATRTARSTLTSTTKSSSAIRTTADSLARTPVAKGRSAHLTVVHPHVAAPTDAGGASPTTVLRARPPSRQFLPAQTPARQPTARQRSGAGGASGFADPSSASPPTATTMLGHTHGASPSPSDSTAQDSPFRATAPPAQAATASLVAVIAIFVVLVGLMVFGAGHRGSRDIR